MQTKAIPNCKWAENEKVRDSETVGMLELNFEENASSVE